MPFPVFAIAIPVLHSSGAWIASTGAAGYLAGTISSTWIGAFILGNSGLLSGLGLVSAAGIYGAAGGLASLTTSTAAGVGTALTAVGLGGMANSLGLVPVATFLGLTPVGWAIAGATTTVVAALGYFVTHRTMRRLNEERAIGGLGPITISQIVKEVRLLEANSLEEILTKLSKELPNVSLSTDGQDVSVDGKMFSLRRLKYVINQDGSEEVVFVTRTGRKNRILLVKSAENPGPVPA